MTYSNQQSLYDVTSSFNQALSHARRERGEPDGGIERSIYDARIWVKTHPRETMKWSAALLGAGALAFAARYLMAKRNAGDSDWSIEDNETEIETRKQA